MSNGKLARKKALRTLAGVLGHAHAAWSAGAHAPSLQVLRGELIRVSLRRVFAVLFRAANLALPPDATLLQRSLPSLELERRIAEHTQLSSDLDGLAEAFLGTPSSCELDLPHALGAAFEELETLEVEERTGRPELVSSARRKRTGTFYTPASLAREVAERALNELSRIRSLESEISVCDPACGAGAFLVELGRGLVERRRALGIAAKFDELVERRRVVEGVLVGIDLDPLAIQVAELALFAFVGDPGLPVAAIRGLFAGDSLSGSGFGARPRLSGKHSGIDWAARFPDRRKRGFDLVIGNPPWVAFAGRATQALSMERRAFYAKAYAAFRGYPTLHATFVERAVELAPRGIVALLVPSPLSDLDGYRPLRRVVTRGHELAEPLLEFGQDAFEGVTQPCFALVARPKTPGAPLDEGVGDPFRLSERSRQGLEARAVEPPAALTRLFTAERLPERLFGEMGLQTTRKVSERLLLRADAPKGPYTYPLLEGREVREFRVGNPRLYLNPDPEVLGTERCRLRPMEDYRRVAFVVRQTAKIPIAALHTGQPFRNTLLAGFAVPGFCAELMVGLLNSALYRALHLALRRDARQSVFPQVKIGHLRALPRPPDQAHASLGGVVALVLEATRGVRDPELSRLLDARVFDLFGFSEGDRSEVLAFLRERAPEFYGSRGREDPSCDVAATQI